MASTRWSHGNVSFEPSSQYQNCHISWILGGDDQRPLCIHWNRADRSGFFSFIDSLFPLSLFDCSQVTVGEAENPRKNIPIAIRRTFWRILIFYIGGVFVIGLIVPSTNQSLFTATKSKTGAAASPFVVATTLVCPIVPLYVLAAQLNLSGWH